MQPKRQSKTMDKLERKIRDLIYEMNDNRNDGWSKEAYRKHLIELKKLIEKALDED